MWSHVTRLVFILSSGHKDTLHQTWAHHRVDYIIWLWQPWNAPFTLWFLILNYFLWTWRVQTSYNNQQPNHVVFDWILIKIASRNISLQKLVNIIIYYYLRLISMDLVSSLLVDFYYWFYWNNNFINCRWIFKYYSSLIVSSTIMTSFLPHF